MTLTPLATHDFADLPGALAFAKRIWAELRLLRVVRAWPDRLHYVDVNGDVFELRGVGFPHPDVVPLLKVVNAAYDPQTVHEPTHLEFKEFPTGRAYPWAHDRAM